MSEINEKIGRLIQAVEDIRTDISVLKEEVKENREHSDEFYTIIKSKWHEGFLQHTQWINQEREKDKEFAARELDELKKKVLDREHMEIVINQTFEKADTKYAIKMVEKIVFWAIALISGAVIVAIANKVTSSVEFIIK